MFETYYILHLGDDNEIYYCDSELNHIEIYDEDSFYIITKDEVIKLKESFGDKIVIHEDYDDYEFQEDKYNIVHYPDEFVDESVANLFWNDECEEWGDYNYDIATLIDEDNLKFKALEVSRLPYEWLKAFKQLWDEQYDKLLLENKIKQK